MNQTVALWALGILATIVGSLSLVLLNRVLQQGDDTNRKVTEQGVAFARLESTVSALHTRVNSLDDWRSRMQQRALDDAAERVKELERRQGPTDRSQS